MGICKLVDRFIIITMTVMLIASFSAYSKELNKENFYGLTLQEAIEYSKDGNPIDAFLDFKRQNGDRVDESYGDYISIIADEYYNDLEKKVYGVSTIIKENIEKGENQIKQEVNKSVGDEKKEIVDNYIKSNIIKMLLIVISIVGIIIGLIVLKNKIIILISAIIFLILMASLNLPYLFNIINKPNKIVEYINNDKEGLAIKTPISVETEKDEQKEIKINNFEYITEDEYINRMCNKKYDVSWYINDYILKVYYCVRKKAQNKEFNYTELYNILDEISINKEREYVKKEDLLNRSTFDNNNPFNYKMNVKTISFDEMEYIYNNITDEDIESFDNGNFIDRILNDIMQKIKYINASDFNNKDMLLSRYLVSKMNSRALCENFFEDDILRALKDWYIEDNETIELPFNVKINFEKQKFIKKDIKEYLGISKDDNNNLIIYYKDSNDNIKGDFILNDYLDENEKFNKSEITYNVKRAVLTMDVDGFKPYYNYEDIDVYDENGNYLVVRDIREAIDDNMSRGTNRDMSLLYMLLMKRKKFAKSRSITDFNFTSNFINKFQIQDNIYEIIPYNITKTEVIKINKNVAQTDKLIRKLILDDASERICIFKIIWTDNYEVDDILTYIVPEDKMNLSYEEMYQLAFND